MKVTDKEVVVKYASLSHSAESRGIEFNLSLKRIRQLLSTTRCAYSRIPFDAYKNKRTIERIDSSKGYTDDNTIAVCGRANAAKADLTYKELRAIVQFMKKKGAK